MHGWSAAMGSHVPNNFAMVIELQIPLFLCFHSSKYVFLNAILIGIRQSVSHFKNKIENYYQKLGINRAGQAIDLTMGNGWKKPYLKPVLHWP